MRGGCWRTTEARWRARSKQQRRRRRRKSRRKEREQEKAKKKEAEKQERQEQKEAEKREKRERLEQQEADKRERDAEREEWRQQTMLQEVANTIQAGLPATPTQKPQKVQQPDEEGGQATSDSSSEQTHRGGIQRKQTRQKTKQNNKAEKDD